MDLLIGQSGLEAIDAAVVKGTEYQPFPTSDEKHAIALDVLEALNLESADVMIDAALSDRYHQVGFIIRFSPPIAIGTLSIETSGLQQIIADAEISKLKLAVCGALDATENRPFTIESSQPSRLFSGSNTPHGCRGNVWVLMESDPAVSISVQPAALPSTGDWSGMMFVIAMASLVLGGTIVVGLSRRLATGQP